MDSISLEEVIMAVRRQSRGFSRGTSAYRGVTHHPSGWSSFLLSLCSNQSAAMYFDADICCVAIPTKFIVAAAERPERLCCMHRAYAKNRWTEC